MPIPHLIWFKIRQKSPVLLLLIFKAEIQTKLSIYMFLEYYIRHFSWIISQIFAIFFLKVSMINSTQRKDFQSLGKKDSNIIEPTKFRYFGFLSSYASFYSVLFYFFSTFCSMRTLFEASSFFYDKSWSFFHRSIYALKRTCISA
jgi:hypothetical protein